VRRGQPRCTGADDDDASVAQRQGLCKFSTVR
jgi:hypothetical protein